MNDSPVESIVQVRGFAIRAGSRSVRGTSLALLLAAALCPAVAETQIPQINFTAESVIYKDTQLNGVALNHAPGGNIRFEASELVLPGSDRAISGIGLDGVLRKLSPGDSNLLLRGRVRADVFTAELEASGDITDFELSLSIDDLPMVSLPDIQGIPEQAAWLSRGVLDAGLLYKIRQGQKPAISYRLQVEDLAFDSPQGRFAGEGLSLRAGGSINIEESLELDVSGTVLQGELLIDNFYRDFSDAALDFAFEPGWLDDSLQLETILLTDNSALVFEGRAEIPGGDNADAWVLEVNRLNLEFPAAYQRYIEPAATAWTLDGLGVTGSVNWSGQWDRGDLSSGDLEVRDLTIVDIRRNRFAITGLDTRLRPGDHSFDSKLGWRGLLFGRLNLGAGEVALDSEPGVIALLEPLVLDVLGGQLNLQELKVVLPGSSVDLAGEPDISLRASLDQLDVELLTAAMDWPSFAGKLSGEVPGVRLQDGVLEVDGEILVSVFDGELSMRDLRVERLFGVLPSLAANIEVSNLDLELLTSTFSFGQISGRLDGYVRELRMLDWRPVAFDAWLGTPQSQDEKNNISRQAVNHLTTIGGGRATTALTSPLLRMFNSFSYRRLGLGCRLQNDACEVRGIGEDEVSVLLMEGAGIPKITIRAFNRRVDWQQMVANLLAISAEDPIRTGN